MDPQELAAQLGYPPPSPDQVGDGFNTGTGVGVPDHTQMPLPSQVGGGAPMPGGLDLSGLANHLDAANSPITSPDQVAEGVPESAASFGAKVSKSGFSTDAYNKVKKTQGPLDAAMAQDRADVEAEYTPLKNKLNAAEEASGKAEDLKAKAEADKAVAIAEGKGEIADAQYGYHNQVQAAYAHARAEAESSKADYRTALANYAAAQVDPGQLWDSKSTAGKFGLMATAFVHDFLGAKGIKTSAMDTINTAIERNIQSQVMAIKQKGEVAAGFKQLWDMQRAQSQSDAEAKDRMHGFYLKALDNEIDSRMGSFDSDLALAKGQAAKAENQKAQIKNDIAVQQHIDAATNARAKDRVSIYGDQLRASTAKAEMDSRERVAKIMHPPKVVDPADNTVINPETNQAEWEWKGGVDKKTKIKVSENLAQLYSTNNTLDELRGYARTIKPEVRDALGITRFSDEDHRKWDAIVTTLAHSLVHANGERATDQDVKDYVKSFPIESVLNPDGVESIIANTQAKQIRNVYGYGRMFLQDLPEGDTRRNQSGAKNMPFANAYTEADMVDKGKSKVTDSIVDVAKQAITRPDAMEPASPGLDTKLGVVSESNWKKFRDDNPEWAGNLYLSGQPKLDEEHTTMSKAQGIDPDVPPASFVGMEALAKHYNTDPAAVKYLEMWAQLSSSGALQAPNGEDANEEKNQELSAFALWELTKLQNDGVKPAGKTGDKPGRKPVVGAMARPKDNGSSSDDSEEENDLE